MQQGDGENAVFVSEEVPPSAQVGLVGYCTANNRLLVLRLLALKLSP